MSQLHSNPGTDGTERARTPPVATPKRTARVDLDVTRYHRLSPIDQMRRLIILMFWKVGVEQWRDEKRRPDLKWDPGHYEPQKGLLQHQEHRDSFTVEISAQHKSRSSEQPYQRSVIKLVGLPPKICDLCREACQETLFNDWSNQVAHEIVTAFDTLTNPDEIESIKRAESRSKFTVRIQFQESRSQSVTSDAVRAVAKIEHGILAERPKSQPRSSQASSSAHSDSYHSESDDPRYSESAYKAVSKRKVRASTDALNAKPRTAKASNEINPESSADRLKTPLDLDSSIPVPRARKAGKKDWTPEQFEARRHSNMLAKRRSTVLDTAVRKGHEISTEEAQVLLNDMIRKECAGDATVKTIQDYVATRSANSRSHVS